MSSFRNCVAVDFWADGMWFWNGGERFHVVHVKGDVALAVKGDCAESKWFSADERATCDLDLTRPWAGICARHRITHAFTTVLLVGPGQIGYATAGGVHIAQLGWFLERYELLPVDETEVACVGVAEQHTDSLTIARGGIELSLSPMQYHDGKPIRLIWVCKGVDDCEDSMRLDRADAKRLMDYLSVQLAMGEEKVYEDQPKTCGDCDDFKACLRQPDAAVPACDDFQPRHKCEGCGKPATCHDNEGVPLCDKCADELRAESVESWKPKVGDECLIVDTDESAPHVDVWAIHGNHAWLGRHGDPKDVTGWTQHITWLRPLPPESPKLQRGDVVCIQVDGREWFGRVFDMLPDFFRMTGYEEDASYSSVVCKMVPEAVTGPTETRKKDDR